MLGDIWKICEVLKHRPSLEDGGRLRVNSPAVVLGSAVLRGTGFPSCNTGEPARLYIALPPAQDGEAAGLPLRSSCTEGPSFPPH